MKVVLFGAGVAGKNILAQSKYEVAAVIDNNPEIQGKQLFGSPVISLDTYIKLYREYRILISTYRIDEIKEQLYQNDMRTNRF